MAGHFMEGPHRVAGRHGLVDGGVIADREPVGIGHVDRRRALVDQPADEGVVDAGEYRVARDDRELRVERHIRAYEEARIADGGGIGIERRLQPPDILIGGNAGGLPGHARFEEQAGLLHMLLALARRHHAVDESRQLTGQEFSRRRRHAGPCAAGDFDQALLLEGEQRLPDRRAADPEALRQLLLGRHRRALLELAGRYGALDMLGDLVRPFASAKRHRGHGGLHYGHLNDEMSGIIYRDNLLSAMLVWHDSNSRQKE